MKITGKYFFGLAEAWGKWLPNKKTSERKMGFTRNRPDGGVNKKMGITRPRPDGGLKTRKAPEALDPAVVLGLR